MRSTMILAAALIACLSLFPVSSAAAVGRCTTSGSATAKLVDLTDPNVSAGVIVNLSVTLGALQRRQFDRSIITAADAGCQRVVFDAMGTRFVLKQENDQVPNRAAISVDPTKPVSYLIVVPDLEKNMQGEPSALLGYALVTLGPSRDHQVWRVYSAIPHDGVLAQDMAAALDGQLQLLMTWNNGQVTVNARAIAP